MADTETTEMATNPRPETERPGLSSVLRLAISDPGHVLPRKVLMEKDWDGTPTFEPLTHWQARAVAQAISPFLAKRSGGDVIHDPLSDRCACEPNGARRCGYRLLADAVIEAFNPPDGDEAEVAICITAVESAAQYVGFNDCECTPEMVADGEPCARCAVLGQLGGKPVDR